MRILSTAQGLAVTGPVTTPRFIVEIELDATYYYSTRETVDVSGKIYVPGYLQISQLSGEFVNLSIYNENYAHTTNALSGAYMRKTVRVWWAYGAKVLARYWQKNYAVDGYVEGPNETLPDPILLFSGEIQSIPDIDDWIEIRAGRAKPRKYPFARIKETKANYAPSAGYTLQFDGQVLRIEGRK